MAVGSVVLLIVAHVYVISNLDLQAPP
jgi:hypothetical protein